MRFILGISLIAALFGMLCLGIYAVGDALKYPLRDVPARDVLIILAFLVVCNWKTG